MDQTRTLKGRTLFITGGSRGIGREIALRAAKDGANIILAAKTDKQHQKLEGTIYTVAKEIEDLGGKCLPFKVDIRNPDQIQKAIDEGVKQFGGIDILVNNASAIQLTGTLETDLKRYDLMNEVNARGTWICSKLCVPHLLKSSNPHILNISPPLLIDSFWFKNNTAYTIAKYGMSMCALGMSEEFKGKIAVNALWPLTSIATAAVKMLGGTELMKSSRKPEIMADAAWSILTRNYKKCSGNFFIDEEILREEGVTDFSNYAYEPGHHLAPDFFVEENRTRFLNSSLKEMVDEDKDHQFKPDGISKFISILQKRVNENSEDFKKFSVCIQYNLKYLPKDPSEIYTLDLKYGSGKVMKGKGVGKPDSILAMSVSDFGLLVQGKLNMREAFTDGKMTIRGNLGIAIEFHSLLRKARL